MRERRYEGDIGEEWARGAYSQPRVTRAPKKEERSNVWIVLVVIIVGALLLGVGKQLWKLLSPFIGG